jgi:tetratricopeptide (TPR) repeat protein
MSDSLIVDVTADGRVAVSTRLAGEPATVSPSGWHELNQDLVGEPLEGLRWYLEDYLRVPYGVYGDRGKRVAEALGGWGAELFDDVFGSERGRNAYMRVRERKRTPVEIVVRSDSADMLGLPWELLRDPSRPLALALDGIELSRSISPNGIDEAVTFGGETLRVLMVIARPGGPRDIDYRLIARPLLELLAELPGAVEVVVLRPPTLAALEETLASAAVEGEPFQVVHFDCHGERSGADAALVFEKAGRGRDRVPANVVARTLRSAAVRVVVLNACKSGAVGGGLEAAIATRLLLEGTSSVVAMAYRVYAVAATEFMRAFYERLFAGGGVTEAVGAGRRRLYERNLRPSPKGPVALADWIVPVHYRRSDVTFPSLRATRPSGRSLHVGIGLDLVGERHLRTLATGGEAFVGRDSLFYELEVETRSDKPVVLYGQSGIGKTELAKAFGRWWLNTGGLTHLNGVVVHFFEPDAACSTLDAVVTQIGLQILGADFAEVGPASRRAVVEEVLARERLMLIWDGFESVLSQPDRSRQELSAFAHYIAAGPSTVIITSRSEEAGLGDVCRIEVGGLARDEAIELADQLLTSYPAAAPRRARRALADLLEWLDGHPLSMRIVLPRLATTEPEVLLAELRGTLTPTAVGSLTECIAASLDRLPPRTQRLLCGLCLFEGLISLRLVGFWAGELAGDWANALEQATSVGLLTRANATAYRIHPAMPALLAARWRNEQPEFYEPQRAFATWRLLDAYARWLNHEQSGGTDRAAIGVVEQERRTLCQLLQFALDERLWNEASVIAQPMLAYFASRGMDAEAELWVGRLRRAIEPAPGAPPALDSAAGGLWLLVMGARAHHEVVARHLDSAAEIYMEVVRSLEASPPFDRRQDALASMYAGLTHVAELRGRLDETRAWSAQSLISAEAVGDTQGLVQAYLNLGIAAQGRGQLEEAKDWYHRSLAITDELSDSQAVAAAYHQLGLVGWASDRLDEARSWSTRSLQLYLRLGDRAAIARCYHQLGIVAQARGDLNEAERCHMQSLVVREELGDRAAIARCCHELGILAQERGNLSDAEDWLSRSLAIREELGDRVGQALGYGQLGLLAEARGNDPAAMEWTVKCVALFDEFPHPATKAGPYELARLTAKLGLRSLETCWQWVTREPLPDAVRDFVTGTMQQ